MPSRTRIALQSLVLGLFVTCPLSRVTCPIVGAEEVKIGYVNLGKVFDGYERTKASDSTLEKKGKEKEKELEGRVGELKKLRESLEVLSDEVRETKSKEVEERADELQRFRTNAARDLRRERDKIAKDILKEIQQGIQDYAKANGFTLILDERSLLYANPAYEVTDGVLKTLNSRRGGKAAAQ